MCALLFEVENTGEHCPLGFVQLAVRMCMHHQRPQFTRRVCGYFALHGRGHPGGAADQIRNGVDDDHKRRQNPRHQPHDRHCILSRKLRVLPRECPR